MVVGYRRRRAAHFEADRILPARAGEFEKHLRAENGDDYQGETHQVRAAVCSTMKSSGDVPIEKQRREGVGGGGPSGLAGQAPLGDRERPQSGCAAADEAGTYAEAAQARSRPLSLTTSRSDDAADQRTHAMEQATRERRRSMSTNRADAASISTRVATGVRSNQVRKACRNERAGTPSARMPVNRHL